MSPELLRKLADQMLKQELGTDDPKVIERARQQLEAGETLDASFEAVEEPTSRESGETAVVVRATAVEMA